MRRLVLMVLLSSMVVAQTPQTPRQALLEMFRATSAEQIDRHMPEVLLTEMNKLPADVRQRQHQAMMMLSLLMAMSPNAVQLFDSGPTLAIVQNPTDKSRMEITVERDDLMGDTDTMEFGIRVTKDSKEQTLPFEPRVLVDMKLEKGTWRLAKIGGSAFLQLDDPKVAALIVKEIQEQAKKSAALHANTGSGPRTTSEANVVSSLKTLATAEVSYAAAYPPVGFTCRLSDLGGSLSGKAADEHGAQLINPALEGGTRYGYKFELSGCTAKSFRMTATPMQKGVGHSTYCTDESAVVKSVGEGGDCLSAGRPLD